MGAISANGPEGWIRDPEGKWSMRFHRDPKSWERYPFVFMDKGKVMNDGSPALLKSRLHLPKSDALMVWETLKLKGWECVEPQWGPDSEP